MRNYKNELLHLPSSISYSFITFMDLQSSISPSTFPITKETEITSYKSVHIPLPQTKECKALGKKHSKYFTAYFPQCRQEVTISVCPYENRSFIFQYLFHYELLYMFIL